MKFKCFVDKSVGIQEVCSQLSRYQFVVVTDDSGKCVGTITDGDLRRSILIDASSSLKAGAICNKRFFSMHPEDVLDNSQRQHRFVPIVDKEDRYLHTITNRHFMPAIDYPPVVIMAGGLGSRMGKLTEKMPKAMLPVNQTPMSELIIRSYQRLGFTSFLMVTNHLSENIIDYYSSDKYTGPPIEFIHEHIRRGTAGSLDSNLLEEYTTIVVTNCDIVTDLDVASMVMFHLAGNQNATVAVKKYEIKNQYGVIELDGMSYAGIIEKPVYSSLINAGIYVLDTQILKFIGDDEWLDMPDLLDRARKNGQDIAVFPFEDDWLDVGSPEAYKNLCRKLEHT